jgi:hypothetical protein
MIVKMSLITRKKAKEEGLTKYYTGKPCKNGHVSERYVAKGTCLECGKIANDKFHTANPTKACEWAIRYANRNKEKVLKKGRDYYHDNKAYFKEYSKRRKQFIKDRTPPWADIEKIREIYALSIELSEKTGIPHHVDHIVPLRGKTVSGLHVHTNLRVIPAKENMQKKNRLIEELL